ncbi:MAG: hypothetical protein ABSD31_16040 [Candidatus Binataceae bacterium]|jgi:hypothetical protein
MAITICANCGHKVSTLAAACPGCGASPAGKASSGITSELAAYLVLFFLALWVFAASPVTKLADNKYTLLLSESILTRHTPNLRHYSIPWLRFDALPKDFDPRENIPLFYQLIRSDDQLLYYYPHGSALLSMPLVAVMRALGRSVVWSDGSYDEDSEMQEQLILAAFLMAVLACVFLRIGRILLPTWWSLAIAAGASFGTQIWSTASRALWSHTWEILLLGFVILELLGAEEKRRPLRMVWLASLVSWMFFVRPTGACVVLGVTTFVFLYYRDRCLPYVVTGLAWLVGFLAYSWFTFGQPLPGYYRNRSFHDFTNFPVALAANLVSPSRGLFVFAPELLFVAFLVIRYWRYLPRRRLAVLAIGVSCLHMIVLCGDANWWGGWSYGPRLTTDLIPCPSSTLVERVPGRHFSRR